MCLVGLGQELVKLKDIDLTEFGNRGQNAMAIIEREMKKGAVSGADLHNALVNVTKARLSGDIVPTEIGHALDQLIKSVTVFITRFDDASGASNTLAKFIHDLSQGIKILADNMDDVVKTVKQIGIFLLISSVPILTGKIILAGKALWGIVTALRAIRTGITATKIALISSGWGAVFVGLGAIVALFAEELGLATEAVDKAVDKATKAKGAIGSIQGDANFGKSLKTGTPEDKSKTTTRTKVPQLTAAESAIKSLSEKLKNLRDSTNIVNLSADKRIKLEAEIHRQAQDLLVTHGTELSEKGKLLDCLLYTSPSPRD